MKSLIHFALPQRYLRYEKRNIAHFEISFSNEQKLRESKDALQISLQEYE